jgi:hypothetical protein
MEAHSRTRVSPVGEPRSQHSGRPSRPNALPWPPKARRIDTEAAPIRYVAELVGADTDSERAIRWLIALMVLTCDPLAIALTAATSARRSEARRDEQIEVEIVPFDPMRARR